MKPHQDVSFGENSGVEWDEIGNTRFLGPLRFDVPTVE